MRKFHKLLHGQDALYEHLVPTKEQKNILVDAKNKIRAHLLSGLRAASTRELKMAHAVEPRFRTQGSWAYGSCVQPAHTPPQEMDWDYGVYLPVDQLDDAGTPRVAAHAYFAVVETLLTDLARREHWRMGAEKNHCIRVHVGRNAHVDVALYAAPEDEFLKVNDRLVEARKYAADSVVSLEAFAEITEEQSWEDFDCMMVATRHGVWEPSDAEKVAGWFRRQKEIHGEQIQRVWRDLKAWRDHQWLEGGPSSVVLMLLATRHFQPFHGRDDLALIHVCSQLPSGLVGDVIEEGIDPEHNFNTMSTEERVVAQSRAQSLADTLVKARTDVIQPKNTVIASLRHQWGSRLPNREQDIEYDSPAQQVRDTPARTVLAPVVNSSYAG